MDAHALTKKAGPLPVWGWVVLAGGGLGLIILVKKGKTPSSTGTSESEAEALKKKELEELVQGVENAGSAGGTQANTPVTPEAQRAATLEALPQQTTAPVETPAPATVEPPPLSSASQPTPHPATQKAAQYGVRNMGVTTLSGKRGPEYRAGTYKGMAAHIYDAAVHGGVGPGKNIVVLNAGKKTHAKKGEHQPAHVKDKTPARNHVTTRTPRAPKIVKPAKAKAKAPKKKIVPRAATKTRAPKKKVKR
jgi:hypothetical protein